MGESTGLSIADAMALRGDEGNDGFANSWIWVFFLFFLLAWGGNGFGFGNGAGVQGALTRSDMCQEFNFNDLHNAVRNTQQSVTQGLCDGFYSTNMNMQTGFSNVARDLGTGFNAVNANINDSRFAAQQCCCETNRNIDAVRYEGAKNTCDITSAIHAEGEATRALINANTMQALRDKLEDRDRELMTANFQLSQQAQNSYLLNELRPCAKPAYITCSPYVTNGCGYGCGIGV